MANVKLDTPVQYLKGVGPKVAKLFKKLGVAAVEDLVYFFPRDYEDRSLIRPIIDLAPSDHEVIRGEIIAVDHQMTRGRFSVIKAYVSDRTGDVAAVWFNQPFLTTVLRRGVKIILSGKVEISNYDGTLQFTVKDFEIDTGETLKIVPRYPLTEGLYPKKVRSVVKMAVDSCLDMVEDLLPEGIKEEHKLIGLREAIRGLQFPEKMSKIEPARRRLAFDDFFLFQLGLGLRRDEVKKEKGIPFAVDRQSLSSFIGTLHFKLTGAQNRVFEDILGDLQAAHPMNRLLQGDVGSGKTIVAALAALVAVNNGYQAAIMAPTEILAQQHYEKFKQLLKGMDINVQIMTGSQARKQKVESRKSKIGIIIGTHALIQDKVQYEKLGLVVIDEQHRFGVLQRAQLAQKGLNPHILIMTATPIPRSLALTLYGDLDRSVIDEMPPGRTPIKTYFVTENKRKGAYEFMREKIKEGRQIYVVCPLVEESEKTDLKAAMEEAERLQEDIFPEFKVGLMHGRIKSEEKDAIMKQFAAGKIHILVSTTVIEVGIDVANATVMVIEHAERFGLAQLHQLRGRIGRGSEQSFCFLIGALKSPEAKTRIKAMLDSTDGFKIAEVDLQLRGPGDFYGTKQSGLPDFRAADIVRDELILREAREAAFTLLKEDPELKKDEHAKIKKMMVDRYGKFLGY